MCQNPVPESASESAPEKQGLGLEAWGLISATAIQAASTSSHKPQVSSLSVSASSSRWSAASDAL